MSYQARVFRILIASPSDVEEEREQISRVIQEWNDLYSFDRKIVLLPLKWETHASPEYGIRPQEVINKEVVDYCDMAVGVFWTRLGSPTGISESGTVEEIERVGNSGKIVMLYFSKSKVELDDIDLDQYKRLKDFKKKTYPNGLIESYKNIVDFRDKFAKQLEIKLRALISKDDLDDDTLLSGASIEIGLYDSKLGKEIRPKSKIVIDAVRTIDIDAVPDYKPHGKDDYKDKDYYKNILENLIQNSRAKDFTLYLKNTGQIGIRDIYIELRIQKSKGIRFKEKAAISTKLENLLRFTKSYSYDVLSKGKKSNADHEEFDDHYLISFKFDALQPQRIVQLEQVLPITVLEADDLKIQAVIYADCFPKPLTQELSYKLAVKEKTVNAMKLLEATKEL